jgi:hypothetical protein
LYLMKTRAAFVEHSAGFSHARSLWKALPRNRKADGYEDCHIVLYDDPFVANKHFNDAKQGDNSYGNEDTLRIVVILSEIKTPPKLPKGIFCIEDSSTKLLQLLRILRPGT